ncbi:MAG: hypothetical protein WBG86_19340, partial [Polyangiales bacterium]
PMCDLVANGWPNGQVPAGYPNGVPEGFSVGQQLPLRIFNDQNGNTDVSLSQFYGRMVVLIVAAVWDPVSGLSAMDLQASKVALDDFIDAVSWPIHLLIEGPTPGEASNFPDAGLWADTYGLTSPVAWGSPATEFIAGTMLGSSLPTFVIADPELEVREVTVGFPGDEAFRQSVQDAFDAFKSEQPAWTMPCTDN